MSDLGGVPGELRFTVTIKRKDSDQVERYDLVGQIEAPNPEPKEITDERNPLDRGA